MYAHNSQNHLKVQEETGTCVSMCKDAATATITNVVQKVVLVQSALYILPDTWAAPCLFF